jgi:hypothetical protein
MQKHTFSEVSLSDVKVIMMIMRVPVEELLCLAATGQILVPKYLLSGVHGRLWTCPVMSSIICRRFPRARL